MSTLDYQIVDVFTDRAFAGNPLAVSATVTGQVMPVAEGRINVP
jgi:predicted PhzF superfamily epimerase YddE/YHI9